MKISCIIPTYNRNKLLIDAINSVLEQTVLPDEIIIVNNGKETSKLPEEICKKVLIYNIIYMAGASQARNFGASVARGEYLAFLDDDDIWNKKYIESVLEPIKEGAKCILSRIDIFVDGKLKFSKNPHGNLTLDKLLIKNPGTGGPNIVIERNLFLEIGGYDVKLITSEDKSLIIELIKKGIHITTLPENQVIARQDPKVSRLSDPNTIAQGIYQFTNKYKNLMNKRQLLANFLKIYKYRYKSGKKMAIFPFIFLYISNRFLQIIFRNKLDRV